MKKFLSSLKAMVVKVTAPAVEYIREFKSVVVDAATEGSRLLRDLWSQFLDVIVVRRETNSLLEEIFSTADEINTLLDPQ